MAKRISLREFQEDLVRRLASVARGEGAHALLGIQAGSENWLLDLADSAEVIPSPPLYAVPLTRPWFRGATNIRGSLFAVVDFSAFQGGPPTPLDKDSRLLVFHSRLGINCALLINRTLGLRKAEQLEPVATDEDSRPWVQAAFRDTQDRQIWKQLNLRQLIQQPSFLEVGV